MQQVCSKKEKSQEISFSDPILEYSDNILQRDRQYVQLLQHYVKNQKRMDWAQLVFKSVFFVVVCVVFVGVVYFSAKSISTISQKETISWTDLGTALTGLGSILGVIIILPSKIAEHLFPSSSDKNSMEFIKSMQAYDLSISSSPGNKDCHIQIKVANNSDHASSKDDT